MLALIASSWKLSHSMSVCQVVATKPPWPEKLQSLMARTLPLARLQLVFYKQIGIPFISGKDETNLGDFLQPENQADSRDETAIYRFVRRCADLSFFSCAFEHRRHVC